MYEDPDMIVDGTVYRPRKWHERTVVVYLLRIAFVALVLTAAVAFRGAVLTNLPVTITRAFGRGEAHGSKPHSRARSTAQVPLHSPEYQSQT